MRVIGAATHRRRGRGSAANGRGFVVLCALLAGCSTGYRAPTVEVTASNEPLRHASMRTWEADPARLEADVRRAIDKCAWGQRSLTVTDGVVTARASLPIERQAEIVAWPVDDAHVTVVIRVGHFGHRPSEVRFLSVLAKVMAGDPAPQRGGGFELP